MREGVVVVTLGFVIVGATLVVQSSSSAGVDSAQAPHSGGAATMATDQKIERALSAAPADLARNATVVEPDEQGQMKTLRAGTNGWVCMAAPEIMCLDKEWQGWADAWINKKDVQVKGVGIAYMLQGDQGVSNTDPYATKPAPDNQWVQTGPHIMILTPDTAQLDALPTEPYNGGPWVMWKGTKYAHIMVPVGPMPKQSSTASSQR